MTRKATLPKLTRREREASRARFGFDDCSIPAGASRALTRAGVKDAQALARIGAALGAYRWATAYAEKRLAVKEREEQARAAAAVLLDLIERIPALDPQVVALINAEHFERSGESLAGLWDRTLPALADLHALLLSASRGIQQEPARRGRKPNAAVNQLFAVVLEVFEATGAGKTKSRELAGQLLSACSIEMPETERSLRRRSTGQK